MRTGPEPYPRGVWSSELLLALSPDQTFDQLITNMPSLPGRHLFGRLARLLLTLAIIIPIIAVQRVTVAPVAMTALSWSFVLAIQILVAMAVIGSSRARRVSLLQALDLWFAGHVPYSLWMLAVMVLAVNSPLVDPAFVFATAVVPAAWTAWIVAGFCRRGLNVDVTGARRRAAAHQAIVWAIASAYAAFNSGGWSQVVNA